MNFFKRFIEKRKTWLNSRALSNKVLMLIYHRIGELDKNRDPYLLTVSRDNFIQHLSIIKKKFHTLSLSEFLKGIGNNELPDRSIILTFDDGYVNNLTVAKKLLEEFKIPGAFFLTSGFIGSYFWWDKIIQHINSQINKKIEFLGNEYMIPSSFKARGELLNKIFSTIQAQVYENKINLIKNFNSFNFNSNEEYLFRCMNREEIINLSRSPYIEIGGHTKWHLRLSRLNNSEQLSEIMSNKIELEEIVQKEINFFAYPFGDFNSTTKTILEKKSFRCGLAGSWGINHRGSDRFELKRISVNNWNGRNLNLLLRYWL